MSTTSQQAAGELASPSAGELPGRPPGRKWKLATATAVVVAAGAVAVAVIDPFHNSAAPAGHGIAPTGLQPVAERSLSAQTQVDGTLGYAQSYTVLVPGTSASSGSGSGTFTTLPPVGQVVRQGHRLYSVDGSPVVLLYGPIPAYRTLSQGMTGTDVKSLNGDLVALGYATRSEPSPASSYFSAATATALEKLQAKLGVLQTGSLTLGQAVFLPTQARVTSVSATVAAPARPARPCCRPPPASARSPRRSTPPCSPM